MREEEGMGAVKKFNKDTVYLQLRHVLRDMQYPKNVDIDKDRTHLNYSLTPKRNIPPHKYLAKRLSEIAIANQSTMNLMGGWIITKPKELDDKYEEAFFKACYQFLVDRYKGEENVITADVHKDESGEPHMHFCFIPVAENKVNANQVKVIEYLKNNPEANNTEVSKALNISRKTVRRYRNTNLEDIPKQKLSAKEVINKRDLVTFHSDLQEYLDRLGIPAKVKTGVTKANGGNRTVEEMKAERDIQMEYEKSRSMEFDMW